MVWQEIQASCSIYCTPEPHYVIETLFGKSLVNCADFKSVSSSRCMLIRSCQSLWIPISFQRIVIPHVLQNVMVDMVHRTTSAVDQLLLTRETADAKILSKTRNSWRNLVDQAASVRRHFGSWSSSDSRKAWRRMSTWNIIVCPFHCIGLLSSFSNLIFEEIALLLHKSSELDSILTLSAVWSLHFLLWLFSP